MVQILDVSWNFTRQNWLSDENSGLFDYGWTLDCEWNRWKETGYFHLEKEGKIILFIRKIVILKVPTQAKDHQEQRASGCNSMTALILLNIVLMLLFAVPWIIESRGQDWLTGQFGFGILLRWNWYLIAVLTNFFWLLHNYNIIVYLLISACVP